MWFLRKKEMPKGRGYFDLMEYSNDALRLFGWMLVPGRKLDRFLISSYLLKPG